MERKDWAEAMTATFNIIYQTTAHIESMKQSMERLELYIMALTLLMYCLTGFILTLTLIYGCVIVIKKQRRKRTGSLKVNKPNELVSDTHFSFNKDVYP